MPQRFIFYDISDDFTTSQQDFDFDLISINTTVARQCTLPDAWLGATVFLTNSGSQTLDIRKPDTSALLTLGTGQFAHVFCYADSSGVPQWACSAPMTTTGAFVPTATYTETNVTTDRAYNANASTLDEALDVLGTLIADLRAKGLVA